MRSATYVAVLALSGMLQPSAMAGDWKTTVDKSEASGISYCSIDTGSGLIVALVMEDDGPTRWAVSIGYSNEPGSPRYLKVDQRRFYTTKDWFSPGDSDEIVFALSKGETAAIEWTHWPDLQVRREKIALTGFAGAASKCEKELAEGQ